MLNKQINNKQRVQIQYSSKLKEGFQSILSLKPKYTIQLQITTLFSCLNPSMSLWFSMILVCCFWLLLFLLNDSDITMMILPQLKVTAVQRMSTQHITIHPWNNPLHATFLSFKPFYEYYNLSPFKNDKNSPPKWTIG